MVEFYRDILDGPLYIIAALLALFFIMAIMGFIMERLKLKKEEKDRIAYIDRNITPLEPIDVEDSSESVLIIDDKKTLKPFEKEKEEIVETSEINPLNDDNLNMDIDDNASGEPTLIIDNSKPNNYQNQSDLNVSPPEVNNPTIDSSNVENNLEIPASNPDELDDVYMKKPVIIFEDPDNKEIN